MSVPIETMFSYAIQFLMHCDENKEWKLKVGCSTTCGYTGPGIGLVIQIFEHNQIYNDITLEAFLNKNSFTLKFFRDVINETIGNFADFIDETPATNTKQGIRGIIKEHKDKLDLKATAMETDEDEPIEIPKIEQINEGTFVKGVNIISFTTRKHVFDTMHHSTLYIMSEQDICFIIDSWINPDYSCRPLSFRQFTFTEVTQALLRLNADDVTFEETVFIMNRYFMAPPDFPDRVRMFGQMLVHAINPNYIKFIYQECERKIKTGEQQRSNFGGYLRKKINTKSKKYRKRKYIKSKKLRKKRNIRTKNKF